MSASRPGTTARRMGLLGPALGLFTLILRWAPGPWPVDDAYITFRYARNLLEGAGLVYNPGEPVLGTSAPGFALLLALGGGVTGLDLPRLAVAVSGVADAMTALMLLAMARHLGLAGWAGACAGLAWALYPLAVRYAVGGMETSVATALGMGALVLWLRGAGAAAMAPAGLALLVRPDLLAHAGAIALGEAVATRRVPWRPLGVLGLVLLPWAAVATVRYGSPIPHSVVAKSQGVYHVAPGESLLQVCYFLAGLLLAGPADLAAEGIAVHRPPGASGGLVAVAALVLAVFAVGAWAAVQGCPRAAVPFAVPLLFGLAYAGLGLRGTLMAEWYLVPVAPVLLLGLVAGSIVASRRLPRGASVAAGAALALVLAQAAGWSWGRVVDGEAPRPRIVRVEREELYREAALFLRPRLGAEDVVAAPEIGSLGYHCRCRILDTAGLVSPRALRYYPLAPDLHVVNQAVPPGLVRDERPAWIVTLDVFAARSLLAAPGLADQYQVERAAPARAFGSRSLLVLRRREGA